MKKFRYHRKAFTDKDFIKQTTGLCAATCVANACRLVGHTYKNIAVTETLAALAMGMHKEDVVHGAGATKIIRGLQGVGVKRYSKKCTYRKLFTPDFDRAIAFAKHYAVIACVEGDAHWVIIVIDGKNKATIVDPDNTRPTLRRISLPGLKGLWRVDGKFFGVGVK